MHVRQDDDAPDVLYHDAALLVLNKPAGLLAVPGRGADKQDCLSARVQARHADALIVHRLDMATSGLMLMARGAAMQRTLSMAFAARAIHKRYVAVVAGDPRATVRRSAFRPTNHAESLPFEGMGESACRPEGRPTALAADQEEPHAETAADENGWHVIDLPILLDWPNRPRRIIETTRGKPSLTRWRAQAHPDDTSDSTRLDLQPVTGRSHQLRVHLAAIGHPILGDALYAPPAIQARAGRLLLHATTLALRHPITGVALRFHCAAPF